MELLTTGGLHLPVLGEPADWLRSVRRSDVTFDEWWERSLALDAQLGALSEDGMLPAGPDRVRIETRTVSTHLRRWAS